MVIKEVPNCWLSGGPLLKKREKWRTPSLFWSMFKDKPALYFLGKVAHPPDCVSVMAFTLVCDGKRRLGEAANFSDGRFSCCLHLRERPVCPRFTPGLLRRYFSNTISPGVLVVSGTVFVFD